MDKFGFLNTAYALAGGDLLKMEAIMQLPYQTVFLKLYHDKETYLFQKRYREVVSADNKH